MIKELGMINEADWNEKIQIELSVADLQIIYDCVGAVPLKYLNLKHKDNSFTNKFNATMVATMVDGIYNELDEILFRHNGLTDDRLDIDDYIELDIIRGDE